MQNNQYPLKRSSKYLLRCGYAAMLGKMVHFMEDSLEPLHGDHQLKDFPHINNQETYWANRLIWC